MKIEYLHASTFGNGAQVAQEFQRLLAARGAVVNVRHIKEADPGKVPEADLYLFSSPGRMGRPIGSMRKFLKRLSVPAGAQYALLTTEGAPQPDKKTGQLPTEEEQAKYQKVTPMMREALQAAGLVEVAAEKVLVNGMRGPLEDGWQGKVEAFAARIKV